MQINPIYEKSDLEKLVPKKAWFTLREACEVKNLNYKTSCNRTSLQPNRGKPDGRVGGRKMWKRDTILNWIVQTDEVIGKESSVVKE